MNKEQALVIAKKDALERGKDVAIYYRKSDSCWYVWWKTTRFKDKDVTEWEIIKLEDLKQ